ncbi:hypothetical protein Riv7116_4469 [Rivularia sp. PCC 7116]|uniref:hypothetical protein n=1 Tax=Rivularia sp. PCC 7116 TaxID=373994 RepID=UPI00029EF283|nr:hypothetical protein [Rivularia sp. PCC 7116]AFY56890.1 hypothetical protein Riv7116_4469 [Rivularia sp. PCC 7116]
MVRLLNKVPKMQRVKSKMFLWGLAPCLISGLLSCSNLSEYGMNAIGVNVTSIGELKPPKSDNEAPVYIQGKVERKVPLLEQQMYQIEDSTGKVWVLTNQNSWKVGDKVVVKALPQYESIPVSGTDLGEVYLEEK